MKKQLSALLLVLCLVLSLFGCSSRDSFTPSTPDFGDLLDNAASTDDTATTDPVPQPDPAGDASDSADDTDDGSAALWNQLHGVWLYDNGDKGVYLLFGEDEEGLMFLIGEPTITATVMNPLRPAAVSDLGGGSCNIALTGDADVNVMLNASNAANGTILLESYDGSLWNADFAYAGDSLDDVLLAVIEIQQATVDSVAPDLAGVWLCEEDGLHYFVQFSKEGSGWLYTTGIPFSDYFMNAQISGVSPDPNGIFLLNLHFPAIPPTEMDPEGMDAFDTTISLDPTLAKAGTLVMTNLAGSGELMRFSYAGASLEDVSLDSLS